MDTLKRAREVLGIEVEGLQKVANSLDDGFERGVSILLECLDAGHKIVVTGVGKNLHIAHKISATLASTGSTSVLLNPSQAMHGDLGVLSEGDAVLALSDSGESEELVNLVPVVKRAGIPLVALTGNTDSFLASNSDAVINAAVPKEACPFNMAPTASTTAALALGDAIAMVLLEARGFKKEDYAKLHPGGTIGRTLLLRVSDIMRKGDRLAVVESGSAVRDAVLAMTSARAGSSAITDRDGRLLGILTDGDLRRQMTTDTDLLRKQVDDIMTPSPVALQPDDLAVDVLSLFESKNIDDIIVVDGDDRVVGAIDIQDLPKLKIL